MRSFYCSDQFVKLQLYGSTVPGLCVLDQEYHQERPNIGPLIAQTTMISTAAAKVRGCPTAREVHLAKRSNRGVVIHHSLLYIAIPAREDSKVEANPL